MNEWPIKRNTKTSSWISQCKNTWIFLNKIIDVLHVVMSSKTFCTFVLQWNSIRNKPEYSMISFEINENKTQNGNFVLKNWHKNLRKNTLLNYSAWNDSTFNHSLRISTVFNFPFVLQQMLLLFLNTESNP